MIKIIIQNMKFKDVRGSVVPGIFFTSLVFYHLSIYYPFGGIFFSQSNIFLEMHLNVLVHVPCALEI